MKSHSKRWIYSIGTTTAAALLGVTAIATLAPSASASASTSTATTVSQTVVAAAARHHGPKPTVVLIHGGFADAPTGTASSPG